MTSIIKQIALSVILFSSLLILPANVKAASAIQACDINGAGNATVCKDQNSKEASQNPIIGIIKTAINVVSYMAGAAAVIGILISSIRFLTASGDENSIAGAKKTLIFSGIGIIVVLIAQAIVAFALKKY